LRGCEILTELDLQINLHAGKRYFNAFSSLTESPKENTDNDFGL
jgi:hypothetical protein